MKPPAGVAALLDLSVKPVADVATAIVTMSERGAEFTFRGPADDSTLFEIGSITKVFTTLLLADMVQRGEVGLNDPIDALLPPGVRAPRFGERPITLHDLATQSSGMPRLPFNFWFPYPNLSDPYKNYGERRLYGFVNGFRMRRRPGSEFRYSNVGFGLLGNLLGRRLSQTFGDALRERIFEPLGMESSTAFLDDEIRSRHAVGRSASGRPVPLWNTGVLAGAGAVRSNARDMAKFLACALGSGPDALVSAMRQTLAEHLEIPCGAIGLGWIISGNSGVQWHNGGTGGFRSYIGVTADRSEGVVVLHGAAVSVDRLAIALLAPPDLIPS